MVPAIRYPTVARGQARLRLTLSAAHLPEQALIVDEPFGVTTNPKWLAGKVAAYAICIFGGIMIRVSLRPFGPAFGKLMSEGSSPEVEKGIGGAMSRAVPYVFLIWAMVLVATFLGVVKPGTMA